MPRSTLNTEVINQVNPFGTLLHPRSEENDRWEGNKLLDTKGSDKWHWKTAPKSGSFNLTVLGWLLCHKRANGCRKQLMDYGKNIPEHSCFPNPWLCSWRSPFKTGKWHRVAQAKAIPSPLTVQKFEEGNQVTTAKSETQTGCYLVPVRENTLFFLS